MNKVIFVSILLVIFISSCKKDNTNNDTTPLGTITATIDGKNITFDNINSDTTNFFALAFGQDTVYAFPPDSTHSHGLSIQGYWRDTSESYQISIGIAGQDSITVNTYGDTSSTSNSDVVFCESIHQNLPLTTQSNSVYSNYFGYPNTTTFATVTITSINHTSVQGTFSGLLNLQPLNSGAATQTITNGRFNLLISHE